MKKIIALFTVMATSSATFAANTDTLELKAVVDPVLNIVVNDAAAAQDLDILAGANDLPVASVDESANTAYKISMFSTNAGNLKSGSNLVPYQIKYGSGAYGQPGATAVDVKTGVAGGETGVQVLFKMTAVPTAAAGTYEDVVTFTIAAN